MTRQSSDLREQLIEATISAIAENGLANLSLRTVTAAIGRSTAAVFHHFGSKDGLLEAAVETGLHRDTAFHDTLASDVAGIPLDAASAADFVAHYIGRRVTGSDAVPRFCWEMTFNADQWAGARQARARHHAMQAAFWRRLFAPLHNPDVLSECIADLVAMESVFASVLFGRPDYDLLMREMVRQAFGSPGSADGGVAHWLSASDPPHAPRAEPGEGLAGKLVESAARQILLHGVGVLNHRRLTAIAGVSPSMIVYHFGDNERFTEQAIWAALLRDLPSGLDFEAPASEARQGVESWYARLLQTLGIGEGDAFYVGYARIVGQACLLARGNAALVPLIRHLRILEGAGIHHASRTVWPAAFELTRAQAAMFAIWIKGFALSDGAARGEAACRERLAETIEILRSSAR